MKLLHTIHIRSPIRTALAVLAVAAIPAGAVSGPAIAAGDRYHGKISLVSDGASGGGGGNALSYTEKGLSVSAHGRYVVFSSDAPDLVANDTNGLRDVFVRDTVNGLTTLVSVGVGGSQATKESRQGSISADGRYVAFTSHDANLVAGDTNNSPDVFVRDLRTNRTKLVSVGRDGQSDLGAHQPEISADGHHVAFTSDSTNLVAADTNNTGDVFVRDLDTGRTERISLTAGGRQSASFSSDPAVSANGRFVVFTAASTEVSVRDRTTNTTRVVSRGVRVDPNAVAVGAGSSTISNDGRYVVFAMIGYLPGMDPVPNTWLRDLRTDRLELISKNHLGQLADNLGSACRMDISADGRYVTFSTTSRLTPEDEGSLSDVFRVDRKTGSRLWISRSQEQLNPDNRNGSFGPAMSDDGLHVAFSSDGDLPASGGAFGYNTYLWSSARPS